MILVGFQRGGGANLAAHLINRRDNDHVTVVELRGFVGTTLREVFDEAHAISKATKAKQYLFSLSLKPPRDAEVSIDALKAAADRAEARLGLTGHGPARAQCPFAATASTHLQLLLAIDLPTIWREEDAIRSVENRRRAATKTALARKRKAASGPSETEREAAEEASPSLAGWDEFDADGLLR